MKTKILIAVVLTVLTGSISFSQSKSVEIKPVENSELIYTLTYLDSSIYQTDAKKHFFVKGYLLPSQQEIPGKDGDEVMKFYYFLVSSFDEDSHKEAILFKTSDLIS